MAARLNIEYIEFQNFLSYGNYVTRLDIRSNGQGLGTVLILGENTTESETEAHSSNGAGKSTLLTTLIWGLFGRTITNPSPGDKVINWDTDCDCYVKIVTTDGWEILRTRNLGGRSELIVKKDGILDETLSTSSHLQEELEEKFGLDYDIFVSSVFCGQLGKAFLETPAAQRRESLEKILGLDKLNEYANTAKEKTRSIETALEVSASALEIEDNRLIEVESQIGSLRAKSLEFENNRQSKISRLQAEVTETQASLDKIILPDEGQLRKKWDAIALVDAKLNDYRQEILNWQSNIKTLCALVSDKERRLNAQPVEDAVDLSSIQDANIAWQQYELDCRNFDNQQRELKSQEAKLLSEISLRTKLRSKWLEKRGTVCPTCEQPVQNTHIQEHVDQVELEQPMAELKVVRGQLSCLVRPSEVPVPEMTMVEAQRALTSRERQVANQNELVAEVSCLRRDINQLEELIAKNHKLIEKFGKMRDAALPSITLIQFEGFKSEQAGYQSHISGLRQRVQEVASVVNPYDQLINDALQSRDRILAQRVVLAESRDQHDALYRHYNYIFKAYSDRKKIKQWLLSNLIPYFNSRVDYYLKALGANISLAFSATLSEETDKWGYDFCSGGERKRVDLGMMLAIHDLHTSIYGQQCNIMILDEVDGRLDQSGVQAFAEVVNNLGSGAEKLAPDTIFIISHKTELRDMFPTQLMVRKDGDLSRLEASA